jgi:hypothetical protein
MEGIPKELLIGAAGSIIGAVILYLVQTGFQLTKSARESWKLKKELEEKNWKSQNIGQRQGITNAYLFSILRYLFLGNLLWLIPEAINPPAEMLGIDFGFYVTTQVLFNGSAIFCFILGLASILRYQRLRAIDKSIS